MQLQYTASSGVNIVSAATILSYTYGGTTPLEVLGRVDLGDSSGPIAGNGDYVVAAFVNGVPVLPVVAIAVPAGTTAVVLAIPLVPLYPGDAVAVTAVGLSGDTAVDVRATLRSATPLQYSDVYGGGPVPVDQNYGGANALAYETSDGAGISGATVLAYLTGDYNAGKLGDAYVQARTLTIAGGAFQDPLWLYAGQSYTLVYVLPGQYGPSTAVVST